MFPQGYSLQVKLFFSSTKLVSTNQTKYAGGVVLLIAYQFNSFLWNIFAIREKLQVR